MKLQQIDDQSMQSLNIKDLKIEDYNESLEGKFLW